MFTLNVNPGEQNVLHVEHPWEQCNVDDAVELETIDEADAVAALEAGTARSCEHCRPLEPPSG